ncbi:MAG: HDOD domain-containing protein [Candidatus Eisenbacteria bacterium]
MGPCRGGAVIARSLAVDRRTADPEEAMLAGLIHDAGRLVLNLLMPEHYEPVMRSIYNREGASTEIERRAFGFDHALVGRLVLEKWNFPDDLIRAVERHHEDLAGMDALTRTVRATDELLWLMGFGVREATEPPSVMPPALAAFGYTLEDLSAQEEHLRAAVHSGNEFFGQV